MHKHDWYDCRWTIRHIRKREVIWEISDKRNILVDEGEKAIVDTFFRNNGSTYFAASNFYIGLYDGVVAESTVLATLPGEPSGNGYSRQAVARSSVGFPTLEQNEGNWRVVSKSLSLTASGGSIGPVNGAFLGTSSDDAGSLIGAIAMGVERTILTGDTVTFQLKIKIK